MKEEGMSSGGTSSRLRITRRRYQTERLGRKDVAHLLLPTAQAVNRVAARFGLPFLGWDETAGSLSWEAPPALPNGGQVALKAAIVKDSGTPRIVVGLREEIVDRNATLAGLSWRAAFALMPQNERWFLEIKTDELPSLEKRLETVIRHLFGEDRNCVLPDVLADDGEGDGPSADDQLDGITSEGLTLRTPQDRLIAPTQTIEPRDEWERLIIQAGTHCGVSLPHEALSSEGLYE